MNFKNTIAWLLCATTMFNPCFAMLSRTSQAMRQQRTLFSPTRQRLVTQGALFRARHMTQPVKTAPIATTHSPSTAQNKIWSYWNSFKSIFSSNTPTSSTPQLNNAYSPIGQSELSMFIPVATIQTLKAQALESAFNVIKENRKEFDLKNGMDGLISCGYPGPELLVLSKIKSSKDFEQFFSNKRKQAFKTIGFSDNEIDSMMITIEQNRKNVIKEFYTQSIATTQRDQNLPKNIIETTDKILMKADINPGCVSLLNPTLTQDILRSLKGVAATALGAHKDDQTIQPAILKFYFRTRITEPTTFNFLLFGITVNPHNLTEFVIAHEIGHLIRNHTHEIKYLESILKQQSQNYTEELHKNNPLIDIQNTSNHIFENVQKELGSLYELEADATVALLYPEIAQSISQEFLKKIENKGIEQLSTPGSAIHSSTQYKHELIQKILQIHDLEKTQQQPHSEIE